MKTTLIFSINFLLFQVAMYGQDSTEIISSKAYRIQFAYHVPENSKDTLDYSKEFNEGNGFVIIQNFINHKGIISIDQGENKTMFLGLFKERVELIKDKSDTHIFEWEYAQGENDSLEQAVVLKKYVEGSLEEIGEKVYTFYIRMSSGRWDFTTTEIITGKKDF